MRSYKLQNPISEKTLKLLEKKNLRSNFFSREGSNVLVPSSQVSKFVVIEAVGLDLLVKINISLSDLVTV